MKLHSHAVNSPDNKNTQPMSKFWKEIILYLEYTVPLCVCVCVCISSSPLWPPGQAVSQHVCSRALLSVYPAAETEQSCGRGRCFGSGCPVSRLNPETPAPRTRSQLRVYRRGLLGQHFLPLRPHRNSLLSGSSWSPSPSCGQAVHRALRPPGLQTEDRVSLWASWAADRL